MDSSSVCFLKKFWLKETSVCEWVYTMSEPGSGWEVGGATAAGGVGVAAAGAGGVASWRSAVQEQEGRV